MAPRSIGLLLNGKAKVRLPTTMPAVEQALGWPPGRARLILEGDEDGGTPEEASGGEVPPEFTGRQFTRSSWTQLREAGVPEEKARHVVGLIKTFLDDQEGGSEGEARRRRSPG